MAPPHRQLINHNPIMQQSAPPTGGALCCVPTALHTMHPAAPHPPDSNFPIKMGTPYPGVPPKNHVFNSARYSFGSLSLKAEAISPISPTAAAPAQRKKTASAFFALR